MFDTHCHLSDPKFASDLPAVVDRARNAGIEGAITIGTGVADSRATLAVAARYPGYLYASAGIDPFSAHEAGPSFPDALAELIELVSANSFVAIGEIGLDYHYDLGPRKNQRERFMAQLAHAESLALPVIIHVRDAHDDMIDILADIPRVRGVIHSFTGGIAEAERYLAIDWYLAFNGIATFSNAQSIRDAAQIVPEERLLLETDSPYLAPVPYRGKRCEPAWVANVLETLAPLREVTPESLALTTTQNAKTLFNLL